MQWVTVLMLHLLTIQATGLQDDANPSIGNRPILLCKNRIVAVIVLPLSRNTLYNQ